MVVATRQRVEQRVLIELQEYDARTPPEAEDLRRIDVRLLSRSRLFHLEGITQEIKPEHVRVLFDPGTETISVSAEDLQLPDVARPSMAASAMSSDGRTETERTETELSPYGRARYLQHLGCDGRTETGRTETELSPYAPARLQRRGTEPRETELSPYGPYAFEGMANGAPVRQRTADEALEYEEFRDVADECDDHDASSVDVFCKPGVTDAEGETAAVALSYAGLQIKGCQVGRRFRFAEKVAAHRRSEVERGLGNPLIHSFKWSGPDTNTAFEGLLPETDERAVRQIDGEADERVDTIEVRGVDDEGLLDISRWFNLALSLDEMRAVAWHFEATGRAPTDVELQSIALTWSEHCCHKTFKATIELEREGRTESIAGLLRTCIIDPSMRLEKPWMRSAFSDNAGILAFNRRYDLAIKVETHNHPSALEPYGGAHTGLGGVIRDVLGVSAEPIANTDVLCFGPTDLRQEGVPPGVFHPRTTLRGVVRGISDYGNNMGIPTVGGAVFFHPGFTANPLVFCGTVGLLPTGSHSTTPQPGDAVVLLGGKTGRDGLHGATMSSSILDRQSVASTAVQIGAPITEKKIRDALPRLRDEHLYHAITDCGAGGLCSAVGEMGAELGVDVDLSRVPLKYQGLAPWEIWLSEAQERMVLAVPPAHLDRVREICDSHDVEVSIIGSFRDDSQLRVWYGESQVGEMDMRFLHDARPARVLHARTPKPLLATAGDSNLERDDWSRTLLSLLAHPNIRSKEQIIRRYDHEVRGATVIKPLVGSAGHSDAAVLRPLSDTYRGVVLAHGINPLYGELDPHAMAMMAVDEALRNLVAVGGSIDRAVLVDNFCWGDVDNPEDLGGLVIAAEGCRDATEGFGVPFITGKDSLRNTSSHGDEVHSIPGNVLISALGVIPDIRRTVTMDLKKPGSALYVVGETRNEMGGSHYLQVVGANGGEVPQVRMNETPGVMRAVTLAIRRGLVRSCHDLSEGGLSVTAAEMCIAGELGVDIDLENASGPLEPLEVPLFSESPGRFLVEVPQEKTVDFERRFRDLPVALIGQTTEGERFMVRQGREVVIDLALAEIDSAWRGNTVTAQFQKSLEAARGQGSQAAPSDASASTYGAAIQSRPVRTLVLAAAGVNCDRETVEACRLAGADVELVHLNQLLSGARSLLDFEFLVLPGGFSFGDHLGAGSMLATVLRYRLLDDLQSFVAEGRPVLGICNGFQVLARLGLLGPISVTSNASRQFECRWMPLRVEESNCVFLQGLDDLELPIAHGEGRVVLHGRPLSEVFPDSQLKIKAPLRYRENPNGSMYDIAGICNENGNVFGLMPHPERYLNDYHHPDWQRQSLLPPWGLRLFENAISYARRVS